ncbi:thioesterase II family protein [Methylocystis heyeri]|uniref:Alpha/beta fold hydrolase n=1 Tax=Methylocystis heyeri TaxID=391905 RepID=A0A6B8KGD5_9HYPH|nr:alpha/beta fold hydrolase [Methylocystis heyeri]QGM46692.1 alpha/beta fold hydrolase [Methylocystis heyeri]
MPTPEITLFCFPCAGASASVYYSWRRRSPPWLQVVPVELPGRGARFGEPLIFDFERLARQLSEERQRDLPRSFAFFGHSFGALLCYGVAHELAGRGCSLPLAMFVACCSAPTRRDDERLSRLDNDDAIVAELRSLEGTPKELFEHPELLRLTIDVATADFAACRSFRKKDLPPLDVDIFAFGGRDDEVTPEALDAWGLETSRQSAVELFPGGHFFLQRRESEFLDRLFGILGALRARAKR